jgi:hypothetical protein
MKKFGWLTLACLFFRLASAQINGFKELATLADFNQSKLEKHLLRKGFTRGGSYSTDDSYLAKTKKDTTGSMIRRFRIVPANPGFELVYETTSKEEFIGLKNDITSLGFTYPEVQTDSTRPVLYQKQNFTVTCSSQQADSLTFYAIRINKKTIPRAKDIVFAEDLLELGSQEYLAAAFGNQNVKKDSFYFTPTEGKRCTFIFPHTSRQAIFLWKDQDNFKDISFIIIGDQLTDEKNVNAVRLSNWRSKQGIYCGMSLREVQNINKQPINFYNWRTESAGFLAPQNKGELDFEKLKPVFNCMNCGFLYVDKDIDVIQSGYSIEENQKVYVGSFVLLPDKKN